jgi:biopolymer transport protein ExbD
MNDDVHMIEAALYRLNESKNNTAPPATQTVHHRHGPRGRPAATESGGLNLPAMLDITFLLLVFFILTANFIMNEGVIPADFDHGASRPTVAELLPPPEPLIVEVRQVGVSGVLVSLAGQGGWRGPDRFAQLTEILEGHRLDDANPRGLYAPDNPIIIRPEHGVPWADVVAAMNACIRARYVNVRFADPHGIDS